MIKFSDLPESYRNLVAVTDKIISDIEQEAHDLRIAEEALNRLKLSVSSRVGRRVAADILGVDIGDVISWREAQGSYPIKTVLRRMVVESISLELFSGWQEAGSEFPMAVGFHIKGKPVRADGRIGVGITSYRSLSDGRIAAVDKNPSEYLRDGDEHDVAAYLARLAATREEMEREDQAATQLADTAPVAQT